jgi:UDP-3-O-[3-hydroxymyristoyl] glucosamine N-acyltransferase
VIGAASYLGEAVSIGRDARLHPGVTVYAGCTIGERTIIHSGAVIGADGFGIAFDEDHWVKVPQVGKVRIGDDVEIGANTTIDRGALDDTIIEDGVKLDNQIQIAHNVHIGEHTAIAACTGIAGSARIGRHCRIGGAVGIAGHVEIGDRVEISGHTAVTRSISQPGAYTGVYPFEPNREWRRNAAQVRHLNEMAKRIAALEAALEQLTRERDPS